MPDVPALSRGLRLLELLAQADCSVSFGDLLTRLDLPKASLARMLAALRDEGWVERDGDAGWRPAERVRALAAPVEALRRLRESALPALRDLLVALDASVILAAPRSATLVVLASLPADEGVVLRAEGQVIDDLSRGPWGGVAFAHLAGALARQAEERAGADGQRRMAAMRRQLADHGWVVEPGRQRPGVLRVAVPVRRSDGRLLAVLGAGAPLGQHRDAAAIAKVMMPVAERIAARG